MDGNCAAIKNIGSLNILQSVNIIELEEADSFTQNKYKLTLTSEGILGYKHQLPLKY